jgi:hypothetical protein
MAKRINTLIANEKSLTANDIGISRFFTYSNMHAYFVATF